MPIDIEQIRGAQLPTTKASWSPDDVILYHLALGAGSPPTDARELRYVHEGDLVVLPTFSVLQAQRDYLALFDLPGLDGEFRNVLHGEQETTVHQTLPAAAEVTVTSRVDEVLDKGSGALIVLESTTALPDGTILCTNRSSLFVRGAGGFGGPRDGAAPAPPSAPDGAPDVVTRRATLPQQALLYRLTGDKNPLHADPEAARAAGFAQPILHGLCTYGIACRAAVDEALDGDVGRVANVRARFAAPVLPGETLEIAVRRAGDLLHLTARAVERDVQVLSHASLRTRS